MTTHLTEVNKFYAQRLLELREWVQGLNAGDLLQGWMGGLAEVPSQGSDTPVQSAHLFHRTSAPVWPVRDRERVVLFAPGRRTKVPKDLWPCVRDLLEREKVNVEDVCSIQPDLDPDSARFLLSALSRLGAFKPEHSEPRQGHVNA